MITAYKIVLLIVILISLLGVIGENRDTNLRNDLTIISVFAIMSYVVVEIYL